MMCETFYEDPRIITRTEGDCFLCPSRNSSLRSKELFVAIIELSQSIYKTSELVSTKLVRKRGPGLNYKQKMSFMRAVVCLWDHVSLKK